jgi:hypothetical protein
MEEMPHHLPATSRWPILVGLGITMIIIGIITHWLISLLGIVILIFALGGWTQENRDQAQILANLEQEQSRHE